MIIWRPETGGEVQQALSGPSSDSASAGTRAVNAGLSGASNFRMEKRLVTKGAGVTVALMKNLIFLQ
jgi:hypothetical protein